MGHVLVVLDPDFGDRLRDVWPGQAVWITMSPANEPVVRAIWASARSSNHLVGITGFRYQENISEQDRLLAELETIQLHHGPYSTSSPFTVLKVIGCKLTDAVQSALSELGFYDHRQSPEGFIATRSEEQARRLRDWPSR